MTRNLFRVPAREVHQRVPAHHYDDEYHHQDSSEVYEEISRPVVLPDVVTCRSASGETVCGQSQHAHS